MVYYLMYVCLLFYLNTYATSNSFQNTILQYQNSYKQANTCSGSFIQPHTESIKEKLRQYEYNRKKVKKIQYNNSHKTSIYAV